MGESAQRPQEEGAADHESQRRSCQRCGDALVDGECVACDGDSEARFLHREVIGLLVLSVVVVVGFFLTRAAAAANRTLHARDAATWYDLARRDRDAGRTSAAVQALRRATALDSQHREYRLALGSALAANGDDAAARQVLLDLRETTPDSPDVNVQLAHLESRGGQVDAAVRYYDAALQGMWRDDQRDARRRLRVELIRFLLSRDLRSRALSELIVLTSNLPDDATDATEAAQLFLDAGDPERALSMFRRVLQHDPSNATAIEGAGVAAFDAGDYAAAQRYLRGLDHPQSSRAAELRTLAALVLGRDPLRPGLSLEERRNRLILDVRDVRVRVDACIGEVTDPGGRRELERLRGAVSDAVLSPENLRHFPDTIDATYDAIYRIEQQTRRCASPRAIDEALAIIGRRHEADR